MILDLGLLLYLQLEAILAIVEILNRLPTNALSRAILFTLQDKEGRLPRVDYIRRFGQLCLVNIPKETRVKSSKFLAWSEKEFIVGCTSYVIYRIQIPTSYSFGKIIKSSSVIFDTTNLYENTHEKFQENRVLDFTNGHPLELNHGNWKSTFELGGEGTCNSNVDIENKTWDLDMEDKG